MNEEWEVKDRTLYQLWEKARKLKWSLHFRHKIKISFSWIRKEENEKARNLCYQAMKEYSKKPSRCG